MVALSPNSQSGFSQVISTPGHTSGGAHRLRKCQMEINVLAALFLPYEVDIIQSIPLSSRLLEDKLVWAESPNGKFSIHSAYAVATRLSLHPNRGASLDIGLGRQF